MYVENKSASFQPQIRRCSHTLTGSCHCMYREGITAVVEEDAKDRYRKDRSSQASHGYRVGGRWAVPTASVCAERLRDARILLGAVNELCRTRAVQNENHMSQSRCIPCDGVMVLPFQKRRRKTTATATSWPANVSTLALRKHHSSAGSVVLLSTAAGGF